MYDTGWSEFIHDTCYFRATYNAANGSFINDSYSLLPKMGNFYTYSLIERLEQARYMIVIADTS